MLMWGHWSVPWPKPNPVRLVCGTPISVPCKPDFTEADVDELQSQFYAELARIV